MKLSMLNAHVLWQLVFTTYTVGIFSIPTVTNAKCAQICEHSSAFPDKWVYDPCNPYGVKRGDMNSLKHN